MSAYSRNYIMARRGIGISNLQEVSLTNGDIDIDQAEGAGIFRVNCTHQVGIATSTEVGLSADRYPIRVILCSNPASIPQFANEAVCGYWRLTNAANLAVPYSRKPLASDMAIKGLYKMVPGLNDLLWASFRQLEGVAYVTDGEAAVDALNESLYNVISLLAPTAEQAASVPALVSQVITTCLGANRVPYFKVADNIYLRAEPHGRNYQAMGNIPASKVALLETVLTMLINSQRLKGKYDAQSDGIITLSSMSIASMFRHGLFESFEHKEYYTLIMVPVANNPNQFLVNSIRTPPGAPPIAGITLNQAFDIKDVKIKKQMVELANLMVMSSGLMHYLFNHTTGGNIVSGTLLTVLAMYQFVTPLMPNELQIEMTSLLYEALHPSNKRAIANLFFDNAGVSTHGRCITAPRYDQFELDAFIQIRMNPYPAGSHKAFICLQALKRVLQAGLGPFLPWADQMSTCINMCKDVLTNGARSHIGSSYYTGDPPIAQPASLDNYLPELAQYVHTFNKGDSLSMSPHMSDEYAKRSSMNWQNLMKDLKAKDISATSADVVKQFLATSGSVHFTFDPADQTTWGKAVADANLAQLNIANVFA